MQRVADLQRGDVELHAVGDVLGQHFDFDFARHLVEHAAGVAHTVGCSHEVHGDLERDLLVGLDLVEVHVDDVGAERMALDLADQRARFLAVHRQLDERALRLDAGQRFLERERIHHQGLRRAAVAVDDGRHLLLEAGLPRRALARLLPRRRGQRHCLRHAFLNSIK